MCQRKGTTAPDWYRPDGGWKKLAGLVTGSRHVGNFLCAWHRSWTDSGHREVMLGNGTAAHKE